MQHVPAAIQRQIALAVKLIEDEEQRLKDKNNARYVPKVKQSPLPELDHVRYVPIAGVHKIVPWHRLVAAGWLGWKTKEDRAKRRPVTYVHPTEWIDLETGEILNRTGASAHGIIASSISERFLDVRVLLSQCRDGIRSFVAYILSMRNQRGGLVVDLETLTNVWMDNRHSVRAAHAARTRQRLVESLYKHRVLANNQTLTKSLQILGRPTKDEILEERVALIDHFPVRKRTI